MDPLSSKVLNDQIISLRKEVRRAVVHQIHHLTTAAKRLRSKKGTDVQKEKNASKANNMYSEIKLLKNMKPDEISLFALSNFEEDDLKMFVSKPIIAPETKAKAKLCLRKNLRSAVHIFVTRHSEETDLLNKLLEARYLCQEKKNNKKEKKKQKEIENSNSVEQNHLSHEDTPSDSSVPELLLSDSDSINESLDLLNSSKRKEMQNISNEIGNNVNKLPEAQGKKINNEEKKKHNEIERRNSVEQNHWSPEDTPDGMGPEFSVSDSDSVNDSLDLLNKIKKKRVDTINVCSNPVTTIKKRKESIPEEIKTSSAENDTTCNQDKTEAKHVNPFFVNRDSSKYYTYRSVKVNPQKEIEEKHEDGAFQKGFKKNFTLIREKRKNDFSNENNYKKSVKNLGGKNERITNKKEWTKSRKSLPHEDASTNVKLHPSWEAKKKMSISSVPFQGKKITFDD